MRHPKLAATLGFPLLCLGLLTAFRETRQHRGDTAILPITGYDPRDLLSGHYIAYRFDFGKDNPFVCDQRLQFDDGARDAFLCASLRPDRTLLGARPLEADRSSEPPADCNVVLRGRCEFGRFVAGIERFYVSEERADDLARAIGQGRASMVVKVSHSGDMATKELLVDGSPWRNSLKR